MAFDVCFIGDPCLQPSILYAHIAFHSIPIHSDKEIKYSAFQGTNYIHVLNRGHAISGIGLIV